MIAIYWYIGEIDKLKVMQKKIIGNCLFSVILSILAPIFVLSTLFYLSPPKIHYYSFTITKYFCIDVVALHVMSICHQDI
jgi:hypothetical protein